MVVVAGAEGLLHLAVVVVVIVVAVFFFSGSAIAIDALLPFSSFHRQ